MHSEDIQERMKTTENIDFCYSFGLIYMSPMC